MLPLGSLAGHSGAQNGRPENAPILGSREALAQLSGDKKVDLVPLKEVQPLTGYIRGGVTVLGAKREYPVYVDETIELFDTVSVSAGMRGAQIIIAPADYIRVTNATIGAIGRN